MLIQSKLIRNISIFVSILFLCYLVYMIYTSFFIVKNQYTDIGNSTYINQVRSDEYTKNLANKLTLDCQKSEVCEVQNMLDFVTKIPYKVNESVARSSKHVVQQNFGDCDDKSNLLISLLHSKGYEAYFALVPKHIFVIVKLDKKLQNKKALWVNKEPFYILESTATLSKIGFPLRYTLNQIEAIIEPFKNKKLVINSLEYR